MSSSRRRLATGTGDSFTAEAGNTQTLTDAAAVFTQNMVGRPIAISGALPANNGTRTVVSFVSTSQIVVSAGTGAPAEVSAFTWTVNIGSGDTINGVATPVVVGPGKSVLFLSDGVNNWRRIV